MVKIGGVPVTPSEEILVLPRPTSDDIVIRAVAVDMTEYEDMCPKPRMPQRIVKGGTEDNPDSPAYIAEVNNWTNTRFAYLVLRSIEPSEIEWETVKMDDSKTWDKWSKELMAAGLSNTECQRIMSCVLTANSLNEAKLREARDAFLLGQGKEAARSSGQDTEPPSTESGQPANAGE